MKTKKKLDFKKIAKLKVMKVMEGLPEKLKHTKSYEPIEKKLRLAMFSDHKHATILAFTKCKRCQAKHHRRRELIKEFGFKSLEQYLGWKKIMDIMIHKRSVPISSKLTIK